MHSTVSRLLLEKYGMFIKEINHGVKFVFHIQFGNGSPTVRQLFIKGKIKNLISYLYTKLLYLCLYVGKKT